MRQGKIDGKGAQMAQECGHANGLAVGSPDLLSHPHPRAAAARPVLRYIGSVQYMVRSL